MIASYVYRVICVKKKFERYIYRFLRKVKKEKHMSKLYEARRSNLSNPLTKDEVGYTFNCENINYIINNIDEEKYGSYLIGGIVGTGKSSLVDIAAAYSKKKH